MSSLFVRRKNSWHIRRVDHNGQSRAGDRLVLILFRAFLIALLTLCAGCTVSYKQPALPRHAAIEAVETPRADEKFAALIQNADIIYFPTELLGSPPRIEPATRLAEAVRRNGDSFTLGLDLIGGEEQGLLDQWNMGDLSTEKLISQLHFFGTQHERENCRALVSKGKDWDTRLLALRCPAARLRDDGSRAPQEAALLMEEFAAERIVGHFRAHRDRKLLIFLHGRHLGSAGGVPYLVAQKIRARQLVLDSEADRSSRSQLMARSGRCDAWSWDNAWSWYDARSRCSGLDRGRGEGRLQIIDGPPGASGDLL
jgi:hypothetical protein